MIKLFKQTDKTFNTNGDKVIIPLKAKVHKEDNGAFFLDLETNLDYIDDLVKGAIIVAPTPQGEQAFRVDNPIRTRKKISVRCKHVYYDSENYVIADSYVVEKNCNDALNHLNNATETTSPFTVSSNITAKNSYRCVRSSLNEAMQVVLERWGGHLVRNNFNIQIKSSIGVDNGVTVRYAKNLKEITFEENWNDVLTKILPVGKDGILLNEVDKTASIYISSTIQYQLPYTKTVSFTQEIEQEDYPDEISYKRALVADLRRQAQIYLDENSIPQINYTLKANLEKITDIGDIVVVIDERLGVNLTTNVIAYEYDCILEKYTELEFGNFTQKLSNLVSNITSNVNSSASKRIDRVQNVLEQDIQSTKSTLEQELQTLQTSMEQEIQTVQNTVEQEIQTVQSSLTQDIQNIENKLGRNIVTRSLSADLTNLTASDYTIIPLDLSNTIGSKLSVTTTGGIKIGDGVTKILVSGSMSYETSTSAEKQLVVIKNSYSTNNVLALKTKTLAEKSSIEITSVICDVTKDDIIYLAYYTEDSNDIIKGNSHCETSLTVEVLA